MNNGFIARQELPDFGCDYMVELCEDMECTGNKFPVQHKSIATPKIIGKGKYIAYSFKTATLNYLLAHRPYAALIVVYDTGNDISYYTYVKDAYLRLRDHDPKGLWKMNETVKLHIPTANILDATAIKSIHCDLSKMFANLKSMYEDYGLNYELPVLEPQSTSAESNVPKEDTVTFLKKYGISLLLRRDVGTLRSRLESLPITQIVNDAELCLLCAQLYNEIDLDIDAEYMLGKLSRHRNLQPVQTSAMEWTKLQNKARLGNINRSDYYVQMEALLENESSGLPQNTIMIELALEACKIQDVVPQMAFPVDIVSGFDRFSKRIQNLTIDEQEKCHLLVLNAQNRGTLMLKMNAFFLAINRKLEADGEIVPAHIKQEAADYILNLQNGFLKEAEHVRSVAQENGWKILDGESSYLIAEKSLILQRAMLVNKIPKSAFSQEERKTQLLNCLKNANIAYRNFVKSHYIHQAYRSLCLMLELKALVQFYQVEIEIDDEGLTRIYEKVRNDLDLPSYIPPSIKLIEDYITVPETE
ncbi:DUF4365 domain-containing protein [Chitinophaga sedimenti]|nr:DUF4365 domain-containing protein [Chitinophaga sedimenti]